MNEREPSYIVFDNRFGKRIKIKPWTQMLALDDGLLKKRKNGRKM